jgi:hypothetical protein
MFPLIVLVVISPAILGLIQMFACMSNAENKAPRKIDSTWGIICPFFYGPVNEAGKQVFCLPELLFPNLRGWLERRIGTHYSFFGIELNEFEGRLVAALEDLNIQYTRRIPTAIFPLGFGEIKSDEVMDLSGGLGRLLICKHSFSCRLWYIGPDQTLLERLAEIICPTEKEDAA